MFRHYGRNDTNVKGAVIMHSEALQCLLTNGEVAVPLSSIPSGFDINEDDYFLCFQAGSHNKCAGIEITIFALAVTPFYVYFDLVCGDLDRHWLGIKEDYINDEA